MASDAPLNSVHPKTRAEWRAWLDANHHRDTGIWLITHKKGTGWSKPNQQRVEKLLAAGLMKPAGVAKVAAAKRDGSWSRLDTVEALEIPPDLAEALRAYPHAAQNFEAFPRSVKRSILEWISIAKKPDTRRKRIEETASLADQNVRANQWRK